MNERQIVQHRNQQLGIGFLDVETALGGRRAKGTGAGTADCRNAVVQGERRVEQRIHLIIHVLLAIRNAERGLHITRRKTEQRPVDRSVTFLHLVQVRQEWIDLRTLQDGLRGRIGQVEDVDRRARPRAGRRGATERGTDRGEVDVILLRLQLIVLAVAYVSIPVPAGVAKVALQADIGQFSGIGNFETAITQRAQAQGDVVA